MKSIFLLITLFSLIAVCADETKNVSESFCKNTSIKAAKGIFKSQGEFVSSVDVIKESSMAVSGEEHNEENFDLRLKMKKSEACVTLKYFGSKKSCTLVSYQYPGCH
jgi:hypothetical protein